MEYNYSLSELFSKISKDRQILYVPLHNQSEYRKNASLKPVLLDFDNNSYQVKSWQELYRTFCTLLLSQHRELFLALRDNPDYRRSSDAFLVSKREQIGYGKTGLSTTSPVKISDNVWIITKMPPELMIKKMYDFSTYCKISSSEFRIKFIVPQFNDSKRNQSYRSLSINLEPISQNEKQVPKLVSFHISNSVFSDSSTITLTQDNQRLSPQLEEQSRRQEDAELQKVLHVRLSDPEEQANREAQKKNVRSSDNSASVLASMVREIVQKEVYTAAEFKTLCERFGKSVKVACSQINEWSDETRGGFLLEENDSIYIVNKEIAQSIIDNEN